MSEETTETACQRHTYAPSAGRCKGCGTLWCEDCMVWPFGPKKPPLCLDCAAEQAGLRPRQDRARKKAEKTARKNGRKLDKMEAKVTKEIDRQRQREAAAKAKGPGLMARLLRRGSAEEEVVEEVPVVEPVDTRTPEEIEAEAEEFLAALEAPRDEDIPMVAMYERPPTGPPAHHGVGHGTAPRAPHPTPPTPAPAAFEPAPFEGDLTQPRASPHQATPAGAEAVASTPSGSQPSVANQTAQATAVEDVLFGLPSKPPSAAFGAAGEAPGERTSGT